MHSVVRGPWLLTVGFGWGEGAGQGMARSDHSWKIGVSLMAWNEDMSKVSCSFYHQENIGMIREGGKRWLVWICVFGKVWSLDVGVAWLMNSVVRGILGEVLL